MKVPFLKEGTAGKWHHERQKRRKHHIVPWIENPCVGADEAELVFHQRHEANTVELFFDLFFVANLATFTAYHTITGKRSLFAYIGFFAILWATWFQTTLHDVRFARDSIYERVCKTVQFIGLVGLALVGSAFEPTQNKGNNLIFRILCFVLCLTRTLFAIQYVVVLVFSAHKGYKKLLIPLGLNIVVYVIGAIAFVSMSAAFTTKTEYHKGIYSIWWIIMVLESASVIVIACIWRMLSFKKTHLVERMGLLTLIVIGEGAIGVTKTISKMLAKKGLESEGTGLILCIILLLVFLWMLYFDHQPHGHYGTIRQQLWSILHFPLHLAIVGIVEGSQQVALARYITKSIAKFWQDVDKACLQHHLGGNSLQKALNSSLDGLYLDTKAESARFLPMIYDNIDSAGKQPGICKSAQDDTDLLNTTIGKLKINTLGAAYASLGQKLDLKSNPVELAIRSWQTVYEYYWASAILLLVLSIVMLQLTRKHKFDLFDWISTATRILAIIVCIAFLALSKSKTKKWADLIDSPSILPIFTSILFLILVFDRLGAGISNWQLKCSGDPAADDHGHGHESPSHGLPDSKHDSTANFFEMHRPMSNETTGYHTQPLAPSQVNPRQPYSGPVQQHAAMPDRQYMPVQYQT